MILSKFILMWVFAIVFGINGIYLEIGFFNLGFYVMAIASIPYIFMEVKIKKDGDTK